MAFRYSRYSGLTHQNVKIKAMCTVHISQVFPFEYWWIFPMPLNTYVHPSPLPCPVFADFCYLDFTIRNSEGGRSICLCVARGVGQWYTPGGGGGPNSPLRFQKILELERKICHKTRMIITRPTPVLRKIH